MNPVCSVKDQLRDKTLSVKGDQWPVFLYKKQNYDPNDPWHGFMKGELLQKVFVHDIPLDILAHALA